MRGVARLTKHHLGTRCVDRLQVFHPGYRGSEVWLVLGLRESLKTAWAVHRHTLKTAALTGLSLSLAAQRCGLQVSSRAAPRFRVEVGKEGAGRVGQKGRDLAGRLCRDRGGSFFPILSFTTTNP